MNTKPISRGAILRAAWSHARWIAETLGRPIREFIGGTMKIAWAIARGFKLFSYGDLNAWTKPK